jgi:RNA polymerase sigma-70 factor (ECF subfamily)|nr:sigma factor [uncultured Azospirillum sp.]
MTGAVGTWTRKIAELFEAHRLRVERAIARRIGDPQTAGDAAQDAFLRLARLPDGEVVQDPAYIGSEPNRRDCIASKHIWMREF